MQSTGSAVLVGLLDKITAGRVQPAARGDSDDVFLVTYDLEVRAGGSVHFPLVLR
jgi:hypothetical protein